MNGDIYSAGFIILPAGLKFPTVVIPFLDWLKTQSEDHKITIPRCEMSDYNGRSVRHDNWKSTTGSGLSRNSNGQLKLAAESRELQVLTPVNAVRYCQHTRNKRM